MDAVNCGPGPPVRLTYGWRALATSGGRLRPQFFYFANVPKPLFCWHKTGCTGHFMYPYSRAARRIINHSGNQTVPELLQRQNVPVPAEAAAEAALRIINGKAACHASRCG